MFSDSAVSRFHANIKWAKGAEVPVVSDNGSQNGTLVNGKRIRGETPLEDEARIVVGPFALHIELTGEGTQALLKDVDEVVALFSDDGDEVKGELASGLKIRDIMEQLETGRRTGTLKLTFSGSTAKVVYCLGQIMSAEVPGHGRRTRALERLLQLREGQFEFSGDLEPQEEAMNLWFSDYLRARDNSGIQTQRFERRPEDS